MDAQELDQLLAGIAEGGAEGVEDWASYCGAVQLLVHELLSVDQETGGLAEVWSQPRLDSIGKIYRAVPATADLRNHLL